VCGCSIRGCVSIARRLQDPLADKWVKIAEGGSGRRRQITSTTSAKPNQIGRPRSMPCRSLAFNAVGVDWQNTAAAFPPAAGAGLSGMVQGLAQRQSIVQIATPNGPFSPFKSNERHAKGRPRMGPKAVRAMRGFMA